MMHLGGGQSLLRQVKRSRIAQFLAVGLALLPLVHPILRPALGPPSHLLWFLHVFPVAWASYAWGVRGAAFTISASLIGLFAGEANFGAGYGHPADEATRWALVIAVGATEALVSAFAQWIRHEEEDLAALERLATTALDASLDGVLLLDAGARVRYANQVASNLFQPGGQDLLGWPLKALLGDEPAGSEVPGPTPGRWEAVARSGTGQVFPAEFRSSPIPDSAGRTTGWLVTVRDRSQELQHEEADRRGQALSELGTVVAGIAHELNNPLTTVGTYAELLAEQGTELPPAATEAVEAIVHESNRAAGIVRQLLDRVRQRTPDRTIIDVNELIDRAIQARAPVFAAHAITVVRALEPSLPPVKGSAGEIEQILVNLLANARYAMHKAHGGGKLTVTARRRGEVVDIEMADDGPGIAPADLARIFDPFFSTKGTDGNGLGLAIARRSARTHGGDLTAANRPDGGACFTLRLPIAAERRVATPAGPVVPPARRTGGGISVLIVDDERGIRRSLCRLLGARGFRVTSAADTDLALRHVETKSFDAILSDAHLPGGSGIDFYRALVAREPRLADRFILMTGDVLGPDVGAFLEETGCAHVSKPFETAEVIALLERVGTAPEGPASVSPTEPHAA